MLRTILLLFFCAVCVTYIGNAQAVNALPGANGARIDSVYLISPAERFDTTLGKLDEFMLRDAVWPYTKGEIIRRAKEKGANVALLRFYGGMIRTVLFYADDARIKRLEPDPGCSITIFRDSGPGLSGSSYAVTLNGVLFRFLDGQSFARTQLAGCPDSVEVKINRHVHTLAMHGRNRYFRLTKHEGVEGTGTSLPGGGVAVMVPVFRTRPNYELIEIDDEELGRLVSGSLKRRPAAKD